MLYTSGTTANPKGCVYTTRAWSPRALPTPASSNWCRGTALLAAAVVPYRRDRAHAGGARRRLHVCPVGAHFDSGRRSNCSRATAAPTRSPRSRRSGCGCSTTRASRTGGPQRAADVSTRARRRACASCRHGCPGVPQLANLRVHRVQRLRDPQPARESLEARVKTRAIRCRGWRRGRRPGDRRRASRSGRWARPVPRPMRFAAIQGARGHRGGDRCRRLVPFLRPRFRDRAEGGSPTWADSRTCSRWAARTSPPSRWRRS